MGFEVKFTDNIAQYLRLLESQKAVLLEDLGRTAEGHAKLELENTPRRIDTGNLRNSITHQVDVGDDSVTIGTNVEYAIYVHEGTRKMDPNRFLKNGIVNNIPEYKDIILRHLKNG